MGGVFISYRRSDTAGEATALARSLRDALGDQAVFMDVEDAELGRDFREILDERLNSVEVVLVLIGKGWLALDRGKSRLEQPNDYVRRELKAALDR